MAENADGQEKTEDPSGKRLQEAQQRGQQSKSQDVTTAGVILLGGFALSFLGKPLFTNYKAFLIDSLSNATKFQITDKNVEHYLINLFSFLAQLLLPLLVIMMAITLTGEISQVGFKIASKKFTEGLNFKKIFNPFEGIKKMMFSSRSMVELVKSFLKLIVLGLLAYSVIDGRKEEILGLIQRPYFDIAQVMASVALELFLKMGMSYSLIALGDFIFQKWKHKQDLKMTKQEVKEESKQAEGDQMVKSRIRSLMRGRLRKLMMDNVPKADVVITNPTHFAVALSYKPGETTAPIVVAKGVDFIAFRIREVANKHDIPIVEDPPLARAIYFNVEIEDEIPDNLFKAVAQVLAYVYSIKKKS